MQSTDIQSPSDLLSIALATASEGSKYFSHCQQEMSLCANEASAGVFAALSKSEQERRQTLLNWAEAEGLNTNEGASALNWQDPNVGDTYDTAAVDPIRSTPYRVLAMFANRADTGFRFYSYVAAYSDDEAIREYAEILAEEELERACVARKHRRVAWHAQRELLLSRPELQPDTVDSLSDLLCVSAALERCVCVGLGKLTAHSPALIQVLDACNEALNDIKALASSAGSYCEIAGEEAEAIAQYCQVRPTGDVSAMRLQLYGDLDRCFVYYDALVNCADDEAIMLQAQQFAFSAMARIDLLHEAILEK